MAKNRFMSMDFGDDSYIIDREQQSESSSGIGTYQVLDSNEIVDLLNKLYMENAELKDDKCLNYKCEKQEKECFDILKLDEEEEFCCEWSHRKILNRLHNHNIDCYFVDMWGCDEIALISGITGNMSIVDKVARVLGIHKECIYYDYEHCFMILNLFQEKYLRGLLK